MDPELVRRFGAGDLIACSTLQDGLERFETSFGAIAYRRVGGMAVTLGGPLAAPGDRLAVLERFLARHARPVFFYLCADVVRLLDGSGLFGAGMGVDRDVDLRRFLDEPPEKPVRGALRKAERARFSLAEIGFEHLSPGLRAELDAINARYLAAAKCHVEMAFLNRPMSYRPDGLRRLFLLEKRDREGSGVFGFAVLNPIFDRGAVQGYLLDILRLRPTRRWGVWPATVHHLARRMRDEGLGLSVGFAPLQRVRHPAQCPSRLLRAQLDGFARLVASAPYLRRLRELKELVPGRDEPRYFASFSRSLPVNLRALTEAMGVGLRDLLGADILHVFGEGLRAAASAAISSASSAPPARGSATS